MQALTRIKDMDVAELKKIGKDVERRVRDYQKLYDLVKNQRNKFVNLIQVWKEVWEVSICGGWCGRRWGARLQHYIGRQSVQGRIRIFFS